MSKGLYKALNIEAGETTAVFLLIFQSIFLGVFYGTFDISAHALFLGIFEPEMIPKAYIISGIVGIIMTTIYSWLQARMKFSVFAVINLVVVAILTLLMRFGFMISDSQWHIFLVFVMMGPLNIMALLGFWGTVSRIFTLRQGKRLFGLIDTGQILGIILASYAIPVLLSFKVGTRDLLFISSVSIFGALLFQIILSGRVNINVSAGHEQTGVKDDNRFFSLFKSKYITQMSTFVVLLVIVIFFVHYSFLAVAKENYKEEVAMAAFLGYFNGTLMIFSILVKTFVYGRLMKTYGLKVALALSPLLLFLFTAAAAAVGSIFGYTAAAAGFTLFFLIISVGKLFAKTLQDSFVAPSMKILYQSLDARIRYNVQARVDGTINEIAALSSGLILTGLGALAFFELIHYTYVLIGVLVAWAFSAFNLYRGYQKSLNDSLAKARQSDADIRLLQASEILQNEIGKGNTVIALNGMRVSEIIDLPVFRKSVIQGINNQDEIIQAFSVLKMKALEMDESLDELQLNASKSGRERNLFKSVIDYFKSLSGVTMGEEQLSVLVKSPRAEDRKMAARNMRKLKEFNQLPLLNTLLRDIDPEVRIVAIMTAIHWKAKEVIPVLIDLLSTSLYRFAAEALEKFGDDSLEYLENAFYKTGIGDLSLYRITRIMGKIGTQAAISYLLPKINHHNRTISVQALRSLRQCGYQANEENLNRINQAIRNVVSVLAWNIAAQYTIQENNLDSHIKKAIQEEIDASFDQLYLLLSIGYDPKSIQHIRENLETGTSESIGFAIELLELVVADEIKPVLFPVLEDNSIIEKIRQLQVEFPVYIREPYDLLLAIIGRDPNYINPYTKACALLSIDSYEEINISQDLLAQMFNPDPVLSELAASIVYKLDKLKYTSVLRRLNPNNRAGLNRIMNLLDKGGTDLIIHKVFFLERVSYLSGLPGTILLSLARILEEIKLEQNKEIEMNKAVGENRFAFIKKGVIDLLRNDKGIGKFKENEMIGLLPFLIRNDDKFICRAVEESSLYLIGQSGISELMFDYDAMAMAMYQWMNDISIEDTEIKAFDMELVS